MKQIIYVDVLIAVNLFVNYFLLLATSKFLYLKWNTHRLIAGEILAAIYSLYIFAPNPGIVLSLLIKFLMSFTIIWVTFGIKTFKTFFKALLSFYFVSFAFSGIMFALWCTFKPQQMAVNNGVVYFDISPLVLIASTLVSYIILEIINRILGKKEHKSAWLNVGIKLGCGYVTIKAKTDTGNALREPFSNLPVIVARPTALGPLISQSAIEKITHASKDFSAPGGLRLKLRMIPFKTVSGEGLLPAFKPDFVTVEGSARKEAYIALCDNDILEKEVPALINPNILD